MIIRDKNKTETGYAIVPTPLLRDKNLKAHARGIAAFIVSCKDDFQLNDKSISMAMRIGITVATSGIKNLRENGYMVEDDKYIKTKGKKPLDRYVFYENPNDNPQLGKTQSNISNQENLEQENPSHININSNNYQGINNISISINPSILEDIERMSEVVKENIEFEKLEDELSPSGKAHLAEMVNVIVETIVNPKEKYVIHKQEFSGKIVQSQFTKLRYNHAKTSLESIRKAGKITHMKSYMISTLFSSLQTPELEQWNRETAEYCAVGF